MKTANVVAKYTKWVFTLIGLLLFGTAIAQGPDISYTPLEDGCGAGARTLTVTITDPDGVPTSGSGLPVLYYRINAGMYIPIQGTHVSGNQYSFTGIGAGGFVGSIIYYYIAAQDNAGNVSVFPSQDANGLSNNPPAADEPPSNPDFYIIKDVLPAGTYTVGLPTSDFPTMSDAVNAYNNSCLNGHVVFLWMKPVIQLADDVFPITINYNPSSNASRTLTIRPGVNSVTFLGEQNGAFFRLNGANYVTIDGNSPYSALPTYRNFQINNQSNTTTSIGVWLTSTATRGVTNVTIKNMNFTSGGKNNIYGWIVSSGPNSYTDPATFPATNIRIENNSIVNSRYGILFNGAATNDQNISIVKNHIGQQTSNGNSSTPVYQLNNNADKFFFRAVSLSNQNNLLIDSNLVTGVGAEFFTNTDIEAPALVGLDGNISNTTISRNIIYSARNLSTGEGAYGIFCSPTNNNNNIRIINNMISRISSKNNGSLTVPGKNPHGIGIVSGTGYRILNNTILMQFEATAQTLSSCLYLGPNVTAANAITDMRNNIFANRNASGARYCVYVSAPSFLFTQIDYNNYWAIQHVGYLNGNRTTLAEWQASTFQDANSVNVNPLFVTTTDFHIQGNSPMNESGTPIALVTTDINGELRDPVTPDIGCDEIIPPPCSESNGGTVTVNNTMVCFSGSPVLYATGYSFGYGISYQWQMSSDGVAFVDIPGETNPITANSPSISATTYYRLAVTCSGTTGYSNVLTVNVYSPSVSVASSTITRCGPGRVMLTATPLPAGATPAAQVRWYDVPTGGTILSTAANFNSPTVTENKTFYVEAFQGGATGVQANTTPSAHGGTIQKGLTSLRVYFKVNTPTKLLSVDIFPYGAGEVATLTIRRRSDDVVIATIPFTTTVSGGATAQTVPINVSLPEGEYTLWTTAPEDFPISGMARNISASTYPYGTATQPIQITGNEFSANYFLYYYRWRWSTACESSRVPVNVQLTTPPAVNVTSSSSSVCAGNSVTLSASSPNPNYIYSWTPGPINGANVVVNPTQHTTYTVTANDGVCANTASISIAMNAMPEDVFTVADQIKCKESPSIPLTVSGGVVRGEPVLFEQFNTSDDPPTGWLTSVNGSVGVVGRFTKRPDGYSPGGYILRSNDQSQFYLADVQWSPTHSSLRTPKLSFVGFATVKMTFYHHYRAFISDTVFIEASTVNNPANLHDPTSLTQWTTLKYFTTYQVGGPTNFKREEIDLSHLAGEPNVYIRFRIKNTVSGEEGFYWALDNVFISGDDLAPNYTWWPIEGLYEDADATIPYTGQPISTVYAKPDETTNYIAASVAPNGCAATDTVKVSLYPVGGNLSGDNVICIGGIANLSVNLQGTGPWTITYTDGSNTYTESGIVVSPHIIQVTPLVNTTYTLLSVQDQNCLADGGPTVTGTATVNLTSIGISSWLGHSNDWFDQVNWCGLVPDETTDVIIPAGLPEYPVINGDAYAKNINIGVNANITINAGHSLTLKGNAHVDGALVNHGKVSLSGTQAQVFGSGSGSVSEMSILEIDNTSAEGVVIRKKVNIYKELSPKNGVIKLEDTITIKSLSTGTGRVGIVGNNVQFQYEPGVFITERYFPEHRKGWQLLSPSAFGQTINQAWQEGATYPLEDRKPGYGIIFTNDHPNALVQGFDLFTQRGSTLQAYDADNNLWVSVNSTLSDPVFQPNGYMVYVRGDRSVYDVDTPETEVTLRSTGHIFAPQEPPAEVTIPAARFQSVGNPYASAVDFQAIRALSTNVDAKFYVWDHSLGGSYQSGGWQTITAANGWRPVPGSALYPAGTPMTTIQHGQAFLVYNTSGTLPGTVRFQESVKVDEDHNVFRSTNDRRTLFAQLYKGDEMLDGNVIAFDENYSNAIDENDARQIISGYVQFGVRNNGIRLSVEARQLFEQTDTVYYDVRNLTAGNYQLRFTPENMPGMEAWLVDIFLGTETYINLSSEFVHDFTVSNSTASRAANRFHIIFVKARPLPVQIVHLQAITKEEGVRLSWDVEHEINVIHYIVEHSVDGSAFEYLGTVRADGGRSGYQYLHETPSQGMNYYRLRIVEEDETYTFSNIVTANWLIKTPPVITIYPNPIIKGNRVNLSFKHLPTGKYRIVWYNAQMQQMYQEEVSIPTEQYVHQQSTRNWAAGIYYVVIYGEGVREKRMVLIK